MEERITLERARELIEQTAAPLGTERVSARSALGRVLAEAVYSPIDQPPFPRSPLDGYAFAAASSRGASRANPVTLTVVDTIYAGGWSEVTVGPGQAVRLMTGAPIPAGCDCVLRQEDTDLGRERVQIYTELAPWDNYCFQGEDYQKGDVLLPAGAYLGGAGLGVLSSAGLYLDEVELTVRRTPRVALLCTGDELVTGAVRPLPPGKIYSSNQVFLQTRLKELGMEVISDPVQWGDEPEKLAAAIRALAERADVILTTGGVSVGEKDIFHQVLPLLGAERIFWRVQLKPGTPLMYSLYQGVPILSLSGNPFAAAATFELLGRNLLAARAGKPALLPLRTQAELRTPFPKGGGMRRFVRGIFRDGAVTLPKGHSSGELRSTIGTNCLVELEAGRGPVAASETVGVYII